MLLKQSDSQRARFEHHHPETKTRLNFKARSSHAANCWRDNYHPWRHQINLLNIFCVQDEHFSSRRVLLLASLWCLIVAISWVVPGAQVTVLIMDELWFMVMQVWIEGLGRYYVRLSWYFSNGVHNTEVFTCYSSGTWITRSSLVVNKVSYNFSWQIGYCTFYWTHSDIASVTDD